jgi:hypothetical protein
MALCQLTYTTNRQINIRTCPHTFHESQERWFFEDFAQLWVFCMVVQCLRTMLDKLLSAGWYVMTNGTLLFAFLSLYKNIQCTHKFSSTHTGEKIIIYCNANCKTENIIYLLECAMCGLQYIKLYVVIRLEETNKNRSQERILLFLIDSIR